MPSEVKTVMQEVKNLKKDAMDHWDEKKLKEIVNKKQDEVEKKNMQELNKHFLENIDNNKYSWVWVCPGVGKCVSSCTSSRICTEKDKKKVQKAKKGGEISLGDLVKREHSTLDANYQAYSGIFCCMEERKEQEKLDKHE